MDYPQNKREIDERYAHLLSNDPAVQFIALTIRRQELTPVESLLMGVVALAEDRARLIAENEKLHRIVPHRVRAADGVVHRWDAPDEFVEIEEEPYGHRKR